MFNKEEKLLFIKEYLKENKRVTKYYVAQNTTIAEPTLGRIVSGETKNPNQSTVDEIYNLLTNTSVNNKGVVVTISKEPESTYEVKKTEHKPLEDILVDRVIAKQEPTLIEIRNLLKKISIMLENKKSIMLENRKLDDWTREADDG